MKCLRLTRLFVIRFWYPVANVTTSSNLTTNIESFSTDTREIFEHFKFADFIAQRQDTKLLYKVVQKVALTDLSPAAISNHDMGLVFEELIRRLAESSNETAGEHFTPRDIVRLI